MDYTAAITTATRILGEMNDQGALTTEEQQALGELEQLRILLSVGWLSVERAAAWP